jgi:hypothetical protein
MIKHVGKHGDRKVAIVFREVPSEEHMALVIYPDTLPVAMHDSIMKVIEGEPGQTAENLGDAMFRSLFPDGRPMLQTLHAEGMIKKVQAKQVVVTPNATSHVNLAEMNEIIRKMKLGEDAIREMAALDQNRGMTGKVRPRDDFGREVGAPTEQVRQGSAYVAGSDAAKALDDLQLAKDFRQQADRMAAEAKGLLAESARLMKEAAQMDGIPSETQTTTQSASKKRGRPSNASKAVAGVTN